MFFTMCVLIILVVIGFLVIKRRRRSIAREKARTEREWQLHQEQAVANKQQQDHADRVRKQQNLDRENGRLALILEGFTIELFYNTIEGITTVMTPAQYAAQIEATRLARLDGLWTHENLLLPTKNAFVFYTEEGLGRIRHNMSVSNAHEYGFVSGPMSHLAKLVEHYQIKAARKEDIFVHYANLTLLDKRSQELLRSNQAGWYKDHLIYSQFPKELQPI
jgi:hypothetical protein